MSTTSNARFEQKVFWHWWRVPVPFPIYSFEIPSFRMVRNMILRTYCHRVQQTVYTDFAARGRGGSIQRTCLKNSPEIIYVYFQRSPLSGQRRWFGEAEHGCFHVEHWVFLPYADKILQTYFMMCWITCYYLMICYKFEMHLLHVNQWLLLCIPTNTRDMKPSPLPPTLPVK